jgi:alkanesulfonate monooxygenase SsuD/methylene tetrahydromethanopterin reductase-like flavin-dependent oxidoreductase (luciferase family)
MGVEGYVKTSIFCTFTYLDPQLRSDWPIPGERWVPEHGTRAYQVGMEVAELADRVGFDWVACSEHHYSSSSLSPNPILLAAAVSQRIKQARIALLGPTLPLTNPVRVAEEFAMLDNLSGGKVVAGLLRGTPNEFLTYSTNPHETRELYEEGIEIILKAWTEPQPFGWLGRHFEYREVSIWPRPVQQPHPPVFMSAASRESAVFGARHKLGGAVSFTPPPVAAQQFAVYKEEAQRAGWTPGPDQLLYRGWCHVAETDEQARQDVEESFMGGGVKLTPKDSVLRELVARAGQFPGPPPAATPAGNGAAPARRSPIGIVNFSGSPDTVARQLLEMQAATGVGVVDLVFQGPALPYDKMLRSVELFGKKVIPQIRDK